MISLSQNDKEKRLAAIQKKKAKLRNPNFQGKAKQINQSLLLIPPPPSSFTVSTVRLSVRNLPKNADEALLRHMFASGQSSRIKQAVVLKVRFQVI